MSLSWEEMLQETFENQIEIEKKSISNMYKNVKEFINLSVQEEGINIILVYGVTDSECFNHIYRMAIYPTTSTEVVYRGGNAIDGQFYNIQDVKNRAKTYLNHYLNKL
jgi:hypothetical protein